MKKIIIFLLLTNRANTDPKIKLGLEIYKNKAMCGSCHSLKAAGSDGQIGPGLDMLKQQLNQIIYTVTNGIGVMPPWKDILSPEEIEAVAYYVFNSTNK